MPFLRADCWGGSWGSLVTAIAANASRETCVWIDLFAVRQWPGNVADLVGVLTCRLVFVCVTCVVLCHKPQ